MRIIIADPHPQARRALAELLRDQPGYVVIGEAAEAESLKELALKQPAHVILLDYELPGAAFVETIDRLHSLDPSPKVIVMSSNPEHSRIALNAKAEAFISKDDQPQWLLAVLQRFERT